MTRDDIERMAAGRLLDICVAEAITGQSRLTCRVDPMTRDGEPQFHWGYPAGHDFAPEYSTDISAAWQALDYLHSKEGGWWDYRITTRREGVAGYYCWIIGNHKRHMSISDSYEAGGSTVPEAICRAILICYLAGLESLSPVGEGGGNNQ
jgi:hypothetical protein